MICATKITLDTVYFASGSKYCKIELTDMPAQLVASASCSKPLILGHTDTASKPPYETKVLPGAISTCLLRTEPASR